MQQLIQQQVGHHISLRNFSAAYNLDIREKISWPQIYRICTLLKKDTVMAWLENRRFLRGKAISTIDCLSVSSLNADRSFEHSFLVFFFMRFIFRVPVKTGTFRVARANLRIRPRLLTLLPHLRMYIFLELWRLNSFSFIWRHMNVNRANSWSGMDYAIPCPHMEEDHKNILYTHMEIRKVNS